MGRYNTGITIETHTKWTGQWHPAHYASSGGNIIAISVCKQPKTTRIHI